MGDIQLSGSAVLVVGGLLSVCAGAITALFAALIAAKNAQIVREQELTNKLLPAVQEISQVVLRLAEVLQIQGAESRERMDRLQTEVRELRDKILTITNRGRSA